MSRNCVRCKSVLPEGSGFCAQCGCGSYSQSDIAEKNVRMDMKVKKTLAKNKLIRRMQVLFCWWLT